jgi:outer membrane protein W
MKDRGFIGKGVNDAVFLNIRTLSDLDGTNISPKDGTGTHITTGVDNHIPYQNGFGMNKCL